MMNKPLCKGMVNYRPSEDGGESYYNDKCSAFHE